MTTATVFACKPHGPRLPYLHPIANQLQLPDQAAANDSIEIV